MEIVYRAVPSTNMQGDERIVQDTSNFPEPLLGNVWTGPYPGDLSTLPLQAQTYSDELSEEDRTTDFSYCHVLKDILDSYRLSSVATLRASLKQQFLDMYAKRENYFQEKLKSRIRMALFVDGFHMSPWTLDAFLNNLRLHNGLGHPYGALFKGIFEPENERVRQAARDFGYKAIKDVNAKEEMPSGARTAAKLFLGKMDTEE